MKKTWTDEEKNLLVKNYGTAKKNTIQKLLPSRTWTAIKLYAKRLNLKYHTGVHDSVEADLSPLLKDDPLSFYWMGFLMADGSFSNNRLTLTLANKDTQHVVEFSKYISCPNHREYSNIAYCVSVKDTFNVPKITKKYNIKKAKTYNPPNINWMTNEACVLFSIGFIDGDGSICFQSKRKDCFIRIKNHSSWLDVLQHITNTISKESGVVAPKAKINNQGYANVNIANSITLKYLKKKIIQYKLPVLQRKWEKINENFISRKEIALENRRKVLNLKKSGVRNTEISRITGLACSTISVILNTN